MTDNNSSPAWAVEQLHKITRSQRRHPRLWQLSCQLQHQVNILAHQIEDPPPGLDQPFDLAQVTERITTIRRLCDEIMANAITGRGADAAQEENYARID